MALLLLLRQAAQVQNPWQEGQLPVMIGRLAETTSPLSLLLLALRTQISAFGTVTQ